MPFEPNIYLVEQIGCSFLSVMARPVPGEWIEEEFAGIARYGSDRVVSLLEEREAQGIGLGAEESLCEKHGMEFMSYPIVDRGLPSSVSEFSGFTHHLYKTIGAGLATVIHCRAGIGRTGIVAAGVLLHCGIRSADAFNQISRIRGISVPDTDAQRQWIVDHETAIQTNHRTNRVW